MEIYFVRHTSVDVPKGVCYGQTNVQLKESFELEAEMVKQRLGDRTFDMVYSSPIGRCTRLARMLDYEAIHIDDRLKEMHFGTWEMQRWDDIEDTSLAAWQDNWVDTPATDGESFMDLYGRVASFLDEMKHRRSHQRILVFTHAGVIACARVYAGKTVFKKAFAKPIQYGQLTKIALK